MNFFITGWLDMKYSFKHQTFEYKWPHWKPMPPHPGVSHLHGFCQHPLPSGWLNPPFRWQRFSWWTFMCRLSYNIIFKITRMTYNSVYEEAEHDIQVADNSPTSCRMTNIPHVCLVVMVTATESCKGMWNRHEFDLKYDLCGGWNWS